MALALNSPKITLQNAGGKAVNLARLARAGFNVPMGFVLPTSAYAAFIGHNNLSERIDGALEVTSIDQPDELEQASHEIRSAFAAGDVPADVEKQITDIHAWLNGSALAVRSSATAEDLPGFSFAGLQDTFLNVIGPDGLIEAVCRCWSSLWTARAMGYRARNAIPHEDTAIAVVIQEMVPSDVSGVLFTANPLTGLRSEFVIDASFGLGEALVSGKVDPDHFVITQSGEIVERSIGSKLVTTQSIPTGGVETSPTQDSDRSSLSERQIRQLAQLGNKIQAEFGTPQDVEWAFAGDELYVLQSRPITSLYPIPEQSYDPLIVWIAFGSVQGLLGPMTPLGRDAINNVLVGAARLFGIETKPEDVNVFVSAGERIWIRISDFVRNPLGYRLFGRLMQFIEPSVVRILEPLMQEAKLGAGKGRLKFSTIRRVSGVFGPVLMRIIRNALRPAVARARFDQEADEVIASIEVKETGDRFRNLDHLLGLLRSEIQGVFEFVLPNFIPVLGPGMASLVLLIKLSGKRSELALEITRGLPDNVTTQMDLALWHVALGIKDDKASLQAFMNHDADQLAAYYTKGDLPTSATEAIDDFLSRYGMRGVGEIDLGRPRWREEPIPIFQTLISYLNVPPEHAPDVVFKRGERSANHAIEELAQQVRAERFGRLKEKIVRAAARRVRVLLGARETPKFMAIRTMGIIREALLSTGREYVAAGTINRADDLYYLKMEELEALSAGETRDWKALVGERRQRFEHEKRRSLVPRVLVSDGRAFFEGVGANTDTSSAISGSPVSPGVVEGTVHIVLDPHDANLEPGDILVCPGTDPAWTPLFLAAAGLITEVGGMMTHGSVVAREYGIPAVVGVHEATSLLSDGQRIRLNGSTGSITLLE